MDNLQDGPTYKAALTMGYFGFLRASNLLCPIASTWGGPHTLKRSDVLIHPSGILILLRSTKTLVPDVSPRVVALPRIHSSPACPTQAWKDYITAVPAALDKPAFLLKDGSPLTPSRLVQVLRMTLIVLGCPYAQAVSSHSLRRGGAQAAQASGAAREDIKYHGTWRSEGALKAYIPHQSSSRVAMSMARLFAL